LIVDARSLADGATIRADIVIVGGGPAGIVLALELTAKGANVCLIEAGGQGYDRNTQDLAMGIVLGDPYPPLRDTRLMALGGSSQVWAGWCRTLDPIDFATRAAIEHSGWPIDRETLLPFYRRAFPWLGLEVSSDDVAAWQKAEGGPLLPLNEKMISPTLFHQSMVRFGSVYRDRLERSANLTVYLNLPVARAFADPAGDRVDCLEARTLNGKTFKIAGEIFVLAAGGVENARLLLASGEDPAHAIGNRHGLVGRHFTEHAFVEAGFLSLDEHSTSMEAYFRQGAYGARGGFALSPELLEQEGLLQAAIFLKSADENHSIFDDPSVKAMVELTEQWRGRKVPGSALGCLGTALQRPDRLAVAIRERLWRRARGANRWRLRGIFECAPQPTNRVRLSTEKDALGRPLPELHWRMGELDLRSMRRAHEVLDAALRERRLGRLEIRIPVEDDAWREAASEGGKHPTGTTRMHDHPGQGVVDRNLQVHGLNNLFVAGSSVFPTGGYANPTLTIVALSLRLADHIASDMFSHGRRQLPPSNP
jgi:choline dehydrogenase-like flavoprotein